ncbi:flagellar hook-length control protein FliK [Devosia sp. RR2S18]|uniref:flagellar hook-length control protein FliK n=1 Tax=Devosia rhizosphaerae TaxID=3049774 RepID=UPI002540FBE5|nr:flagellar hook-length control protein FliK [Devosia sp. RR2S18]WIJ26107.1 flagellar hook-length control protein FliK [Devosia sp. RR2S18]
MASHLTVTSSSSAGAARGFGQQAASGDSNGRGVFAALLGGSNAAGQGTTTSSSSKSNLDMSLGGLVDLSLGFGEGEAAENPEALAAAIDAQLPFQAEARDAFNALIEGLGALKAQLDAGEAPSPELLQTLDAALGDLAGALGLDLSALPSPDELAAIAKGVLPDEAGLGAKLTAALAPLAQQLTTGSGETAEADLLKSIGDKLDAEKLAQLGLDPASPADAALEAALAKLSGAPASVDASANAVELGEAELELTEPVLTGKGVEGGEANANGTPDGNAGGEGKPHDNKGAEIKPAAVAAAAQAEAEDPSAVAVPNQQQARVDAVAAPRVIQAGYQTSQQQLNLPQIAFELVRQVQDGNSRFQIRLDPPELGKIEVKLDIGQSGQINAHLTVERAETLDLIQRDQRALERALQQAGLDGAKTNLEFSLKQNPFSGSGQEQGQGQGQGGNGRQPGFGGLAANDSEEPAPIISLYRGSLSASGVNIIA